MEGVGFVVMCKHDFENRDLSFLQNFSGTFTLSEFWEGIVALVYEHNAILQE